MSPIRWRAEILDRRSQAVIHSINQFDGNAQLNLGRLSEAELTIPLADRPELSNIRHRGHWLRLVNVRHPELSLRGPIMRATFDMTQGVESLDIRAQDWTVEIQEQIFTRNVTFTGHPQEVVDVLIRESRIDTPGRIQAHPIDALFKLEALRLQPISRWWNTLNLAAMDWTVLDDVLVLGLPVQAPADVTERTWEDSGLQVTFQRIGNLVVFGGRNDLTAIWPSASYEPPGFYPRSPYFIEDPNVNDIAVARTIARRTWEKIQNPAPTIQGLTNFTLDWPASIPGKQLKASIGMLDGSTLTLVGIIDRCRFSIVDGVEIERSVTLLEAQSNAS